MKSKIYAGFSSIFPGDLEAFRADLEALGPLGGFLFLDPEDGVNPLVLAERVVARWPRAEAVVPLVCRDANRTALLGAARTAEAVGASGLLLLSGRLDPVSKAKAVYDLDVQQLLDLLGEAGVSLPLWVSSRCFTAAERARVERLASAGASRCLVPWDGEGQGAEPEERIAPVWSVPERCWAEGALPPGGRDLVLHVPPGRGSAALAALASRGAMGGRQ